MAKTKKQYIQYGVEPGSRFEPDPHAFYGFVQWFDGKKVVQIHSYSVSSTDAWRWVEWQLKNL